MEGVFQEGKIEVPELVGKLGRPVSPVVAGGYVLRLLLVLAVGRAFGHNKFETVLLVIRDRRLESGPKVAVGAAELPARGGWGEALASAHHIGRVRVDQDIFGGGVEREG